MSRCYCVVPGCRQINRNKKHTKCTEFFKVPSNKQLLKKWQDAIPGQVVLKQGQNICSIHFRKNDVIRIRDINHVGIKKAPRIRSMLSKDAIPYFFPHKTSFNGRCKNKESDTPFREEVKTSLYDELTLVSYLGSIETAAKGKKEACNIKTQGRNKAGNCLYQDQNSSDKITLNEDSVFHTPLHTNNNQNQITTGETLYETSKLEDEMCISTVPSIDLSDSESDFPDIKHNLSISNLRESIENDLKEYVMCRKELEQTMDLQTNCNQFTFDKLFRGSITIQIPPSWYKIIPNTVDKVVVFANFVLRTDKRDQMLVSYKSICIGEDLLPKFSILDKPLNNFHSDCITSHYQLESIIFKLENLLVCKGLVLGKEFAYLYSPLCYLDKRGHWRHITCSLITPRGYETCFACKKVRQMLLDIKNRKNLGPKKHI